MPISRLNRCVCSAARGNAFGAHADRCPWSQVQHDWLRSACKTANSPDTSEQKTPRQLQQEWLLEHELEDVGSLPDLSSSAKQTVVEVGVGQGETEASQEEELLLRATSVLHESRRARAARRAEATGEVEAHHREVDVAPVAAVAQAGGTDEMETAASAAMPTDTSQVPASEALALAEEAPAAHSAVEEAVGEAELELPSEDCTPPPTIESAPAAATCTETTTAAELPTSPVELEVDAPPLAHRHGTLTTAEVIGSIDEAARAASFSTMRSFKRKRAASRGELAVASVAPRTIMEVGDDTGTDAVATDSADTRTTTAAAAAALHSRGPGAAAWLPSLVEVLSPTRKRKLPASPRPIATPPFFDAELDAESIDTAQQAFLAATDAGACSLADAGPTASTNEHDDESVPENLRLRIEINELRERLHSAEVGLLAARGSALAVSDTSRAPLAPSARNTIKKIRRGCPTNLKRIFKSCIAPKLVATPSKPCVAPGMVVASPIKQCTIS